MSTPAAPGSGQSDQSDVLLPWVLVVEDHSDSRETFVDLLIHHDYPALGVTSAEEALLVLTERTPCLVLADYLLPGMRGDEFFRLVRQKHGEGIPFVFMSGFPKARVVGLPPEVPVLLKPFDIDVLLKLVEEHCRPRR